MVGRSSLRNGMAPDSAGNLALLKDENLQKRAVVRIERSASEVVGKSGARGTDFAGRPQIQVRRQGRSGPRITSKRAQALVGCRGLRGCEFANCVSTALGAAPRNLSKTCAPETELTLQPGYASRRTSYTSGGSVAGTQENVAASRFESRRRRGQSVPGAVPGRMPRGQFTGGTGQLVKTGGMTGLSERLSDIDLSDLGLSRRTRRPSEETSSMY